jgi:hypothetical protein
MFWFNLYLFYFIILFLFCEAKVIIIIRTKKTTIKNFQNVPIYNRSPIPPKTLFLFFLRKTFFFPKKLEFWAF